MSIATSVDAGMLALLDLGASCVKVARRDKKPVGFSWDKSATRDACRIATWLDDGYNVGLLCGTGSLIDVEFDDAEGEQLLHDLGLADIVTPTWTSGRGEHRLFRLTDAMPAKGWIKRGGLEVRLGGKPAQSVLPPSVHPTGARYSWVISPADVAPAAVTLADLVGGVR